MINEVLSIIAALYAITAVFFLDIYGTYLPGTFFALGWTLGYVLTHCVWEMYRK